MFGAPSISTVKWWVTYPKNDITYYLAVVDETSSKVVWSQRKEKAITYTTSSEAQRKADEILAKRKHNKKMVLKVA